MRIVVGSSRTDPALNHEPRNYAMKFSPIIPAALHQLQEVAYVFRSKIRIHLQSYVTHTSAQNDVLSHFVNRRILEWFGSLGLDFYAGDSDRSGCHEVRISGRSRDLINYLDPFGDFDLIFGASKLSLKAVEVPIRYRERTYGTTQISRFRHGWLLLRMSLFALRRIKFI